jgi:hypothetical protein
MKYDRIIKLANKFELKYAQKMGATTTELFFKDPREETQNKFTNSLGTIKIKEVKTVKKEGNRDITYTDYIAEGTAPFTKFIADEYNKIRKSITVTLDFTADPEKEKAAYITLDVTPLDLKEKVYAELDKEFTAFVGASMETMKNLADQQVKQNLAGAGTIRVADISIG